MSFTSDLKAAQAKREEQEDREAFSYGVQIANEQIFRVLLETVMATVEPERRRDIAAQLRHVVERTVELRLAAAQVQGGIEAQSATDVIASVFDGLADDPLPSETTP